MKFILVFFLVYGSAHLYAFGKARSSLQFGPWWSLALALFMTLMVSAPVLVRLAERRGFEGAAVFLAWTGYSWMGVLFLFVALSAAVDALSLAGSLLRLGGWPLASPLPPRPLFFTILGISTALALYGAMEALGIRTEEVVVVTDKIPRSAPSLTMVQISDVHLGLMVRRRRLEAILEEVRKASPDILVSTGDLVDGQLDGLDGLSDLFRGINPKHGMYAVTGNHEFYAGLRHSLDFIGRAGFRLLRGEAVEVAETLTIVGVDDPTGRAFGEKPAAEGDLLRSLSPARFRVLLKHRPVVAGGSCGLFDLQLSGHTHRGQIFPFGLLTRLFFPINSGTVKPGGGCMVHVSRGSGTWGPPMRVLSPPEVTVVKIKGQG